MLPHMSIFSRRPSLRWLVPAVATLLLVAGGSAVGFITASASDPLPERSVAQLLVDVQNARVDGLSGTIVQNADLGLPSLPGIGGGGSSDMTSLVSGSHELRLWYAGPNKVRLALLGSLGESDIVRDGTDLWTWSSPDKSATHRDLPLSQDTPHGLASASPVTPQQAADDALSAISPSTKVAPDGTATVAGRKAYELVLQPKDSSSLVGSVHIAIDGKTHVPTRVQVFAKNASDPALEVGFTEFDPTTPPASAFRFNPPPGTKVTESGSGATAAPEAAPSTGKAQDHGRPDPSSSDQKPKIIGTGWTSVMVAEVPSDATSGSSSLTKMLKVLPTVSGSWGSGHLLQGTLFSAVLTDDGRVAVGAVAPDALYTALARR
jgi:outer membrane lipoprotein-sorting protein